MDTPPKRSIGSPQARIQLPVNSNRGTSNFSNPLTNGPDRDETRNRMLVLQQQQLALLADINQQLVLLNTNIVKKSKKLDEDSDISSSDDDIGILLPFFVFKKKFKFLIHLENDVESQKLFTQPLSQPPNQPLNQPPPLNQPLNKIHLPSPVMRLPLQQRPLNDHMNDEPEIPDPYENDRIFILSFLRTYTFFIITFFNEF